MKQRIGYSLKQLYTIKILVKKNGKMVYSGPFGCGKTYSLVEGFGLYCLQLKHMGITGLNFILLGRTQSAVKRNMCNVLSELFGEDFRYDSSKKSGKIKDATLFGQNLYIIGLNDASSESKFRGVSNIMGILHDEAVLCTKEQFDYVIGRLRGELDSKIKLPKGFVKQWYIGSTNPDAPTHFLLDYAKKGLIKIIKWTMKDARWDGAKEYYERLKKLYKDNPSFYSRYLLGEWTSTDNMVYPMFNYKVHVIDNKEIDIRYNEFKRHIIGVDYGSNHPTGIILVSLSYSGQYIISKEIKLQNTAPSDIVLNIVKLYKFLEEQGTRCSYLFIDPSAKGLKDELIKEGLNPINAINKHQEGIGCIRDLFALNKLYIMSNCENLISEIYSYKFKRRLMER